MIILPQMTVPFAATARAVVVTRIWYHRAVHMAVVANNSQVSNEGYDRVQVKLSQHLVIRTGSINIGHHYRW